MVRLTLSILFILGLIIVALTIYASYSYEASDDMYDALDAIEISAITLEEDRQSITYQVSVPINNIIIIPGGLVSPDSYRFLAYNLALAGHRVTIVKPLFNLAIITPNQAQRFIDENISNIIIGHSLGGVVAAMIAENHDDVDGVVLLASYSTVDISNQKVLSITASNDLILDQEQYDESLSNLPEDATFLSIEGGNHAGFGWYGEQKNDGIATLPVAMQQAMIIAAIITFTFYL